MFLEVRDDLQPNIKVRQPKKTPKLGYAPKPISEAPELTRLHPVLRGYSRHERALLLLGAAEVLRPALDDRERAMLDWLMNSGERNLTALAREIDITKGGASKLKGRVLNLLEKEMTVTSEEGSKLIIRGGDIDDQRPWGGHLRDPKPYSARATAWPWRK